MIGLSTSLRLGGARAFVGALDAFTTDLAVAFSVESQLLSSYSGPIMRVRRDSDNTESDALTVASMLSFVGAASGYIVTLYDQSGNSKDATQSTAANQPRIVNAGALDAAGMKFTGGQMLDIASSPYTDFAASDSVQVASRQTQSSSVLDGQLFSFAASEIRAYVLFSPDIYWDSPFPTSRINYVPSSFSDTEKVLSCERDGTTSRIRVNGSVDHSGVVSGSISGTDIFRIGGVVGGLPSYAGSVKNFCVWKTASSTNCAARAAVL